MALRDKIGAKHGLPPPRGRVSQHTMHSDMGGVWTWECACFGLPVEVVGELRVGALAFAPHVADPRLSEMKCGWQPYMTSYCGKIGKVIAVNQFAVKLYISGKELWWNIQMFDSCLERHCHKGCSLQGGVVALPTRVYCDVCLASLPEGAQTMRCQEHDYDICTYCLGQPHLPAVGERVIRGPTWSVELPLQELEDYYEEGLVETDLLDGIGLDRVNDDIEMPRRSHHSYFQASSRPIPTYPLTTPPYKNNLNQLFFSKNNFDFSRISLVVPEI